MGENAPSQGGQPSQPSHFSQTVAGSPDWGQDRQARQARPRGQLRIYLGAAAGVGKTYAMLGEGHRRAERGADVVVGFAEPHARKQTAALLEGLEVIPRAKLAYRGATFEEMDTAAVI